MILSDWDIRLYIEKKLLKIDPLYPDTIRENGIDLRFGKEFCRYTAGKEVIDSRSGVPERYLVCEEIDAEKGYVIMPGDRILATTLEYVEVPIDLVGLVNLRSTFARLGLYIPPTVIDAGFKGQVTIEIVGAKRPIRVYPGQRFLHVVFLRTSSPVHSPYSGKYQGQRGVTPPKLDKS